MLETLVDRETDRSVPDVEDFVPFEIVAGPADRGLLIIADHASNALPNEYGTLGTTREELSRHIGYDIGSAALTRALAARLGAPAVLSTFSRLLIDPNRGADDPTLVMRLSDGVVLPGNAKVDEAEKQRRVERFYAPYHGAVDAAIDAGIAAGKPPAVFSVHSFTPVWRGWPRPWHAGVLWDQDPRFALPLIEKLREDPRLVVGDNEPYTGALKNDSLYRHGTVRGIAHALIEVRQDLISDDEGVEQWADRLAPIIEEILALPGMNDIHVYGSAAG
ncbi:MAG: N-formylglutamate amidohydrolase [Hyphomicrobiales bacterium]|nr:MAG: N-formylglutamate amidohydrolase [Hyphomicrobiales bacterium]